MNQSQWDVSYATRNQRCFSVHLLLSWMWFVCFCYLCDRHGHSNLRPHAVKKELERERRNEENEYMLWKEKREREKYNTHDKFWSTRMIAACSAPTFSKTMLTNFCSNWGRAISLDRTWLALIIVRMSNSRVLVCNIPSPINWNLANGIKNEWNKMKYFGVEE